MIKETELYDSVKKLLEKTGYKVKSEVKDCDVVGFTNSGKMVVVELKTTANLKLIMQANERKRVTDTVYVALPENAPVLKKRREKDAFFRLLKQLAIGLIVVDIKKNFAIPLLDPSQFKPKKSSGKIAEITKEFNELKGDPNKGGSKTGKVTTAYRQKAVMIAEYLALNGPEKASKIKDAIDEPKTWSILYNNHYGWFEKKSKGVYGLSGRGREEYLLW